MHALLGCQQIRFGRQFQFETLLQHLELVRGAVTFAARLIQLQFGVRAGLDFQQRCIRGHFQSGGNKHLAHPAFKRCTGRIRFAGSSQHRAESGKGFVNRTRAQRRHADFGNGTGIGGGRSLSRLGRIAFVMCGKPVTADCQGDGHDNQSCPLRSFHLISLVGLNDGTGEVPPASSR